MFYYNIFKFIRHIGITVQSKNKNYWFIDQGFLNFFTEGHMKIGSFIIVLKHINTLIKYYENVWNNFVLLFLFDIFKDKIKTSYFVKKMSYIILYNICTNKLWVLCTIYNLFIFR